jgi:hypothetical protein
MAGRHSKRRAHARIPEQQTPGQRGPRPVGIIDARTYVEHLMTDEAVAAHRHSGRYLALCGAQVLAASLAEPRRSRCQPCTRADTR